MARSRRPSEGIVHALDYDVLVALQGVVGVGEISEVPIGIVGIESHRLLKQFERPLRVIPRALGG